MSQVHVITGSERRRSWTEEQKRALVAEAFAPGAVVLDVARRTDVSPTLLYRWRREFGAAARGFAEVVVAKPASSGSDPIRTAIEIEFPGNARVRIPPSTPPALAMAVVKALARR
jgi:transposase